jgi:gag-polyprotein putative aspartyl protease
LVPANQDTQNSISLNIPYLSIHKTADIKTLIDSGATENFLNKKMADDLKVTLQKLPTPRKVTNIDGSENQGGALTHFCDLRICQGVKKKVQRFFITNLGKDRAILGYPWLKDFALKIDWAKGRVEGPETTLEAKWYRLAKKRSESTIIRHARAHPEWEEGDKILKVNLALQWVEAALKNKTPTEILPQYDQYRQVFSEEAAACFPPSRPKDHAIKLKPRAPNTINCKVYPLTEAEKEATRKWVEEHKKKHYIEKSTSPWSTPWFFIKKKDGSLHPIQDYQEVN